MNFISTAWQATSMRTWILLAGLLHFCQIPAMACAPAMLEWDKDFKKLALINRRIFQVMAGAIVLAGLGLGVVVVLNSDEIALGRGLGKSLACFLGVFWGYRALVQIFLYSRIWPQHNWLGRLSHWGLTALFTFESGIYFLAFGLAAAAAIPK